MKLIFDNNNTQHSIDLVEIEDVKNAIANLDSFNFSYVILKRDNNDYIQCAGSSDRLSVEVRIHYINSFKHFVIGRKEQSKVWSTIECNVGPINVLAHEVLKKTDAIDLFIYYFKTGSILDIYNMRNISKYFLKKDES